VFLARICFCAGKILSGIQTAADYSSFNCFESDPSDFLAVVCDVCGINGVDTTCKSRFVLVIRHHFEYALHRDSKQGEQAPKK